MVWLIAAAALLLGLVPLAMVCLRGDAIDRLVGLEMASVLECLALILLAQGFGRVPFYDLAVTLALLAFGGSLVFARFLERWL